ncbi:site-specific integrase [Telmatospirillum sp.]|uniref:tyrosine-type recombinase/integrase n=1 Tax=Telmatospirillum sp. TaxID=2079197 RepID=UPI0028438B35|nr:site-specific integrase [Telmatospirillum sp.]MDR3436383.1 site-specific integrase [Telmatospirillum sp.]
MSLDEAFGRYWDEAAKDFAQPKNDLSRMKAITKILQKDTPFHQIDDDAVSKLISRLRGISSKTRLGHLISNSTINRYVECLRRVWRRAAKTWKIEVGDEPDWGKLLLREQAERVRELSKAEEKALFIHLRTDFHPMVRFALMAGMRLHNVVALTWSQVDLDNRTINIRLKSKMPGGRPHSIPLTSAMAKLLEECLEEHPTYVFTYVCEKSRGKRKKGERYPFTQNGWRKSWATALTAAKIVDFRFHDIRHTAATRTLRATGNIKAVKEMLGHNDIATTNRYAHVTSDDVRAAMEKAQSRTIPAAKATDSTTR